MLALLLLSGAVHAEALPKPTMQMKLKDFELQMKDFAFPSGLRIVFQEDHSQPIVAVTTTIDHGSTSDPENLDGIAHCLEHLWFRSIHKDAQGKDLPKVWDILKEMGGNINASTADDWTNYMTVASKDNLIPLLRLEALRMQSAAEGVTDDVLRVEREVIRNELRLRYENGFVGFVGTVNTQLFPKGHPYYRMGIGTHDTLNNITVSDIRKFAADYYTPANTTITVVGDFSLDDVGRFLNEFPRSQFAAPGDTSTGPIALVPPTARIKLDSPAPEPPEPLLPVEVKGEITNVAYTPGAVEKRQLVLAWALPGAYHLGDWNMRLAANSLSYAILQELYPSWEWTQEEPPVDLEEFGCFVWDSKLASRMICVVPLADDDDEKKLAERALNGVSRIWANDEVYRQFQQYTFDLGLTEVKASVFNSVDRVSTLDARATQTSAWTHYTGDPRYYSTSFKLLSRVNGDEVRQLAEKYLDRRRAVATVVTPYEEGDIDVKGETTQWRGARRDDNLNIGISEAEANTLAPKLVVPPDRKAITVATLPNGMELVTMPYSSSPLVQVALRFPTGGGLSAEAYERLIFAVEHTRNDSYLAVDSLRIGAVESPSFDPREITFRISAPAGNVSEALYVLRARMDGLIAYTDSKIEWVKSQKKDILRGMKEPEDWMARLLEERLYPGHPFGRYLTHADLDRIGKGTAADAAATLGDILRPDNGSLFVVGNITQAEATTAATTWWGGWTGWAKKKSAVTGRLSSSWAPPPAPPPRQIILLNRDNTSQTAVTYACQLDAGDAALRLRQTIMAEVISDGAWLALREATGASYGASAFAVQRNGIAELEQSVSVQNDSVGGAIKAFLGGVEAVKAGKVDSRLTAVMKLAIGQTWVLGHQSTAQMIARLMSVPGDGAARFDWFDRYGSTLDAIRNADFPPMLERCVGHEVVVAVGPIGVIEPQVKATGLAYEVFDWKRATEDYRKAMGLKAEKK